MRLSVAPLQRCGRKLMRQFIKLLRQLKAHPFRAQRYPARPSYRLDRYEAGYSAGYLAGAAEGAGEETCAA